MAEAEPYFSDIQEMATSSRTMDEPMRTKAPVISWDEILIKGAQLARIPLNHDEPINTRTVIGPQSRIPLVIETPIYISHMSFGALSKEAKTALAKGSAAQKTLICSGEGGILPEEFDLFALNINGAVMHADDVQCGGQSQSHALADRLGGEEWIKNFGP